MFKRMMRVLALSMALLGGMATAAEPLDVGGRSIRIGVDEGFVATSAQAPQLHALYQAGLPPTHRLVEAYIDAADLKRVLLGQRPQQPIYQVQVMRDAERIAFSDADWEQGRPQIVSSLGAVDANALANSMSPGSSKRMSEQVGADVSVSFGRLGQPVLYGDDPRSVRFVMLMPLNLQVAGQAEALTLETAGAVARIGDRLLFLYAFRDHVEGTDTSAVRGALDRFVEHAIALNRDAADAGG